MAKHSETPAEACPVDAETRAAWLKSKPSITTFPDASIEASQASGGNSCDSSQMDQSPPPTRGIFSKFLSPSPIVMRSPIVSTSQAPKGLGVDREVSTIPRASPVDSSEGSKPANSEKESGVSAAGNWVYPSERMFFEAMKRKGYQTEAENMKTIVPIHNAVNERAWKEIKEWERPWGADRCGGPKLHSFIGISSAMSPKARLNTLMGYKPPFDRHDWAIDRCGIRVDYIIDFYAGRDDGKGTGKLSFYLDVRPKLNTWEGCKMRAFRAVGLV